MSGIFRRIPALILFAFVAAIPSLSSAWTSRTAATSVVSDQTSIVLDANGNPIIVARDSFGEINYITSTGGGFSVQNTLDPSITVAYCSLALGPDGNPNISYYDSTNSQLKYAKWNGSSWVKQVVDSGSGAGQFTSIAVDAAGNPHISYYDSNAGKLDLKYARWTGTAWSTQTVDATGDVGSYSSIALDPSGKPSISYLDTTNGHLKYANWSGVAWSSQTADASTSVGQYTSITMDGLGYAHISYYDSRSSTKNLKYARLANGSWTLVTPDSTGDVGYYTSIAVDGKDIVQIAYQLGPTSNDLKFATGTTAGFTAQAVDTADDTGYYTSIVIDKSSGTHLAYFDNTSAVLMYTSSTFNTTAPTIGGGNAKSRLQAPTNMDFSAIYTTSVTWTWTDNANCEMGYRLYGSTVSTGTYTLIVGSDTIGVDAQSYTETGLTAGTTYYRYVVAITSGSFGFSGLATACPGSVPAVPALGTLTSVNLSSMTATWAGLSLSATGYSLVASTFSTNPPTVVTSSSIVNYTVTTGSVTSLFANTTYYLFVRANGSLGSSAYNAYPGTSTLANAPTNVQFSNVNLTSMTLTWTGLPASPSSSTCEGYVVQVSSKSDFTGTIYSSQTTSSGVSALTITGLTEVTVYYCRVGSLNWNGSLNFSVTISTPTLSPWSTSIIAANGSNISLALDSNGYPAVAYYNTNLVRMEYAKWDGTAWNAQTVFWGNPTSISIAFDAYDNPAIGYAYGVLKYAKWNGTSWSIQTADTDATSGVSMALDPNGYPGMSFSGGSNDLKYAKWNGTSWSTQTVESLGNVGTGSSLVFDSTGNPAISYYSSYSLSIQYAKWNGTSWSTQTVDTAGGTNPTTSLALDANGNPAIAYYEGTNRDLKYAKWNGTNWSTQTVDSTGDVGSYMSLTLDGNGYPNIGYYDATNDDLKYAQWTGTSWRTSTVDSAGTVGAYASVALDGNGNSSIAYYDGVNFYTKYASATISGISPPIAGGNGRSRTQTPKLFNSSIYSTSVTWNWTDNASNELGYRLYGSTVSTGTYTLIVGTTTLGTNSQTYTEQGLTAGTTYYRYVVAVTTGTFGFSNVSRACYGGFAVPALGQVTTASTGSLTATWGLLPTVTGYTLVASTVSTNPPTVISSSATILGNTVTTGTITGLSPNTTYYLFVRSNNGSGSSSYNAYSATPTWASLPSNIQLSSIYSTSMTVTWTALPASPSSSTCEGYLLTVSTASDFTGTILSSQTTSSAQSSLNLTGLVQDTTYYWKFGSLNWSGAVNYNVTASTLTVNPWKLSTVDSAGDVGLYPGLALDSSGNPAISYRDSTNNVLKYAKWNGTSWITQTPDNSTNVGYYSSLAFDPTGNPGISYYDLTNGDLKYAKWNGTSWSTQTIDNGTQAGQYTSLAFDANGYPAISYYEGTNQDLKYAKWNGTSWSTATIDSTGDVGRYTSIAMDPNGNPAISYFYGDVPALKYARWNGTSWSTQTIDSAGGSSPYPSIALDGNGNPGISYSAATGLKYAKWNGASWSTQTVDPISSDNTSLAFDGNGNPLIGYYDHNNKDLKYANWNGTSWSTQTVDRYGDVGNTLSAAIDGNGISAISYYDGTNGDLKFASTTLAGVTAAIGGGNAKSRPQAPTNFAASSVSSTQINWTWTDNASNELGYRLYGSTVSTGTYTLIVGSTTLGANSNSYTETGLTSGTTYYRYVVAVNAGNHAFSNAVSTMTPTPSWANTTIDSNGTTGEFASMALDSNGNPHIAYHDKTIPALRYAKWTGTGWSTQTVDATSADVGDFTSIALDANDYPHISYRDGANGKLKYAKWTGTAWSTQTVDSSVVNLSSYTSIALDPAGYPHILYRDDSGGLLKHARWTGTAWSTQTLISGNTGTSYNLVLDAAGNDRVVYRDTVGNVLKYISWTGSAWTAPVTADAFAGGGVNPSLAVDGNGYVYVVHQSAAGSMGYDTNKTGSWVSAPVQPAGQTGNWLDIALDGAGNPSIIYRNDTNATDAITYDRWTGAAWSTQTVVNSYVAIGSGTSISIDGTGRILIAYQDGDNFDLEVASITTTGATGSIGGGKGKGRCQAPTNFTAANVYTTSVTWNWTDNASNESGYRLYGSTVSTGTYTLIVASTTLTANSTSYTETGLTVGTTYYRYVVAINAGGYAFSNMANNLFIAPPVLGAVTAVSTGSVTAAWNLVSNATGYTLVASTISTNPPTSIWSSSTTVGNTVTTATVSGLYPNTTYYLFVQSNASGTSSTYAAYSATYTLANLPTSVLLSNVYFASMTVTWTALPATPSSSTCEGYLLQASTASDFSGAIASSQTSVASAVSLTVSALTMNATYYYRLGSLNQAGAANFATTGSTRTVSPWSLTKVDSNGFAYSSLALDANGAPAISYYLSGFDDLKYAKWNGSSWTIQAVDSTGNVGLFTSLAFDANGNPAISYIDGTIQILKYAKWTGSAWSTQTVDANIGSAASGTSLAFDASGNPAIGYYDQINLDLKYAKWTGSAWSTQTVESNGDVGRDLSLAFNANGSPAISYFDNTNYDLKYASWTGNAWSTQTVESNGQVGYNTSLAFDPSGNPAICYLDGTNWDLKYAKWTGGAWSTQTVDSNGQVGLDAFLVFDGNGYPVISYRDFTNYYAKLARWTGSAWSIINISTVGMGGSYTTVALGADSVVHVAYEDEISGNMGLKYASATLSGISPAIGGGNAKSRPQAPTNFTATNISTGSIVWTWTDNASNELGYRLYGSTVSTGTYTLIVGSATLGSNSNTYTETGLTAGTTYYRYVTAVNAGNYAFSNFVSTSTRNLLGIQTVDGAGIDVGNYAALAIDAAGNPHISYKDATNLSLKYAKWSGSAWITQTVDNSALNVGDYSSIAIDVAGNPHISYIDSTNAVLKYAKWTGTSWSTQTVDGGGGLGVQDQTAIAIDGAGNTHIAYSAGLNNDLKYAKWNGISWSTQTIDGASGDNVGTDLSMAIDAAGNPQIAYRDNTNADLKYAKWTGAGWSTQTVDGSGGANVGFDTSLAIDGSGVPNISYFSNTNGQLKYAKWTGAAWSTQTVDGPGSGTGTSIAIDGAGVPFISYDDYTNGDLKYAQWTGSQWSTQTVDGIDYDIGSMTSLAIDAAGKLLFAYRDATNGDLKYGISNDALAVPALAGGNAKSRPQAPTNFAVTALYATSATWSWTDNASNELGYRLYGSTVSTGTYTLIVDSTTLGANSITYTETGLTAGATYYRYVAAVNAGGYAYSNLSNNLVASAPNLGSITAVSTFSVTANWNLAANATGYTLVASTMSTNPPTLIAGSTTTVGNTTGTVSGLLPDTTYFLFVQSNYNGGSSSYAAFNATSSWANLPSNIQIGNLYFTSMTVTWTALPASPSTSTTEGYLLQASTISNFTGAIYSSQTASSALSSLTLTGLDENKTYYWRLGSLNWSGAGNFSVATSTKTLPNWSKTTIDATGTVGRYTSIALDASNNPGISYFDLSNGILKYAKWNGTSWSTQTVDAGTDVGWYTSLAFDSNGYPAISYHDDNFFDLKYAKWNGTSWSTQTVQATGNVGEYTSLALDANGYPAISYYNTTGNRLQYAKWDGTSWSTQTVDLSSVGTYSSLALDASGNPAISYFDSTNSDLKLAQWNGTSWSTQTVDSVGGVGQYTSLAFDGNGNPAISYYDVTNSFLKFAQWNGASWVKQTIDSSSLVGQYTSLAFDGNGYPTITYYDSSFARFKCARWNGTSWSNQIIDTTAGSYSSIAIDSLGITHVSYYDGTSADLKYASATSSFVWPAIGGGNAKSRPQAPTNFAAANVYTTSVTWSWTDNASNELGYCLYGSTVSTGTYTLIVGSTTLGANSNSYTETGLSTLTTYYRYIEAVNSGNYAFSNVGSTRTLSPWSIMTITAGGGLYNSMALDSSGNPAVSYMGQSAIDTKYAKWTGSAWSTQTVETGQNVGYYTSIAFDTNDNPSISYYNLALTKLKYATLTGGSWSIQIVDYFNTGYYSSTALDVNGNPGISYYDNASFDLKYAKWTGSSWSTQTVDFNGSVGQDTSQAMDANGNPGISYYDITNHDLKYAKWTGTAWSTQTVDAVGDVGQNTSLAMDANGNPSISYYDNTNHDLKYAKWTGSAWSTQTVDSSGDVGKETALAIDGNGNPMIGYWDSTNNVPKFAQWTGTSWSTNSITNSGSGGTNKSIAIDANGVTHFIYLNQSTVVLYYATATLSGVVPALAGGNGRSRTQVPTNFNSAAIYVTSVTWSWTDNANNELGYRLYGSLVSTGPYTLIVGSATIGANVQTYSETGLVAGTTYYRYIEAVNSGNFAFSKSAGACAGGTAPSPPIIGSITAASTGSLTATWGLLPTVTGYTLVASTVVTNPPTAIWSSSTIVGNGTTTGTLSGFYPNTTYYLFVRSNNSLGSSNYSAYSATYTLANPPTNFQIAGVYASSVTVNYSMPLSPSTSTCEGFQLQASTAADFVAVLSSSQTNSATLTTLTVSALIPNTTLYFRVASLNQAGATNFSSVVLSTLTLSSWSPVRVDTASAYCSVALNASGYPAISYYDTGAADLKYASWSGSSWSTQTVDFNGNVGQYTSLALDANGNPGISYYDVTNHDLKYAKWTGSVWSTQTIDSNGDVGVHTSLAFDANGNPAISYYDQSNADLKYANWTGSAWSTQTIESNGNVGWYTSLAFDPTNNPAISYYEFNHNLKYANWTGTAWSTQTVDSNFWGGGSTSLAFDVNGNPAISYYDGSNYDLKYAKWTGSSWTTQFVGPMESFGSGTYVSLALDGNGNPLLSYTDENSYYAKLAQSSGGSWLLVNISTVGTGVTYTSMALDANGAAHVVYNDASANTGLMYASITLPGVTSAIGGGNGRSRPQGPTGFSATAVSSASITWSWTDNASNELGYRLYGSTVSTGTYTLIVGSTTLGANSNSYTETGLTLGVTYYRYVTAVNAGNYAFSNAVSTCPALSTAITWSTTTIDAPADAGYDTSLALDASGYPGISYADFSNGLKYAKWNGSVWNVQIVDSNPNAAYNTSLAFDGNGNPGISYWDLGINVLKFAKWNGTSWSTQTVDASANVGQFTSLAFNGSGNPGISYYDGGNGDLLYAKWNGTSWSTQTVESAGDVGQYTSLVFDGKGNPHISYFDSNNGDLKYAEWTGSGWSTQTIESVGSVGQYSSLALDSNGYPAISYCDFTNLDLKYARWNGTSWSTQTVDSGGNVGYNSFLALDGNGNPSISYNDGTNQTLKYAQWNGTSWTVSTADSGGNVGVYTSLAIGGNGVVHISYQDVTNSDLKYASATVSGVTPAIGGGNTKSRPQAPAGFSAANVYTTSVTWSWTDNASNELGYRLYGSTVSTGTYTLIVGSTTLGANSNSYTETGLTAGTTYYRYAVAVNAGNYAFSNSASNLVTPPPMPGAVTAVSTFSVTANWSLVSGATGYNLVASTMSSNPPTVISGSTTTIGNTTGTVSGLLPNTSYYLFVQTNYSGGSSSYAAFSATSTWSNQPSSLQLGNVYFTSMTVTWTALPASPSSSTCEGYLLQASTVSDFSGVLLSSQTSLSSAASLTVSALTMNNTYYYRLGSLNYSGAANYSTPVSTRTLSPWSLTPVDSSGNSYTSLALDASGNPAISYYDFGNGDLKFAKWTGSTWSVQVVDPDGNVGTFTSLAFNNDGNPAISYVDETNHDLKYARWTGSAWSTQTLHLNIGPTAGGTSLAFDPNGNPAISYFDNTKQELKYAQWTGSVWSTRTIESVGSWLYLSLVFNANGNPSISYFESGSQALKYAAWTGNAWATQTVVSNGQLSYPTSLAFDSNGKPGIAYIDLTNYHLSFAQWTGSAWVTQTVDPNNIGGFDASLAFDGNGYPVISYQDGTNNYAKLAQWTGSSWSTINISSAGMGGTATSVAVGANGVVHVAFEDTSGNTGLKYASATLAGVTAAIGGGNGRSRPQAPTNFAAANAYTTSVTWSWTDNASNELGYCLYGSTVSTGTYTLIVGSTTLGANSNSYTETGLTLGVTYYRYAVAVNAGNYAFSNAVSTCTTISTANTWSTATVESAGSLGQYVSLALDASGYPAISYYDTTNSALKYAKWDGSSWSTQTIESAGTVGQYTSIAFDANNYPGISYFDNGNFDLKYAKWNGTSWSTQTVDDVNLVGLYTSLAFDGQGNPGISYFDALASVVKYAKWNGVSWSTQTVDSAGSRLTSSAIDALGNPAISYSNSGNLQYANWNGTSWSTQTVDSVGSDYSSLAFGVNGKPAISYYDSTNGDLKYAKWNGASWSTQTVDSNGDVGQYTSLAMDGSGYPTIAYYDLSNFALKYARWDGVSWSTQTVDSSAHDGTNASIAIDGSGVTHIGYYDATNLDLKYASATVSGVTPAIGGGNTKSRPQAPTNFAANTVYYTSMTWTWTDNASNELGYRLYGAATPDGPYTLIAGTATLGANANTFTETGLSSNTAYYRYVVAVNTGSYAFSNFVSTATRNPWSLSTVVSGPSAGSDISIALDANGYPAISYNGGYRLRYAKWDGTSWSTQTIDTDTTLYATSLVLDANGYPAISYQENNNNELRFARWNGTVWSTQAVDSGGSYNSIALDGQGNPAISYLDFNSNSLKYAKWNGTSWSTQTIDSGSNVGLSVSLVVDAAGDPSVSYADSDNSILKYAQWNGTSWSTQTVDSGILPNGKTSITLDSNGRPAISYYDGNNTTLKYARWNGTSWSTQTVDTGGDLGFANSLVFDQNSDPSIAYYDFTNGALKYAQWNGTSWSTQTVDAAGDAGSSVSLAIDGSGVRKIAYYDLANSALNFASASLSGFSPAIGGGNAKSRPQAPTGFAASNVYYSSITWSWTDNASNELGYRLYGSTASAGPYTLIAASTTLTANANTYTETGLTPNTTYYRYVAAINAGGYVFSNFVSTVTLPPGYSVPVGGPSGWIWKVPQSGDNVPSGTPNNWTWRTWTPGSGRKIPTGNASGWSWSSE